MHQAAQAYATNQNQARSHYQRMQISTADPFELILILYREAIQRLQSAQEHMQAGRIEKRVADIAKAQDMIGELTASLDFEKGRHIARSLSQLYEYMMHRLIQANTHKDPEAVREVIGLLKTLESAWAEARHNLDREGEKPQGDRKLQMSA